MKKLQNLGRSLSKDEQKKIIGGYEEESGNCTISCSHTVGNTTTVWTCKKITYQGQTAGCSCPNTLGTGCSS